MSKRIQSKEATAVLKLVGSYHIIPKKWWWNILVNRIQKAWKHHVAGPPLSETQIVSSSTLVRTIKTQKIMQIAWYITLNLVKWKQLKFIECTFPGKMPGGGLKIDMTLGARTQKLSLAFLPGWSWMLRGAGELDSQRGLDSRGLPCFSANMLFPYQHCY